MNWNMNCRKTRRLLALGAGNDLAEREYQVAERHLAVCPSCREAWNGLQQSQQVLESVRSAPIEEREQAASSPPVSAWAWVDRHIRSARQIDTAGRQAAASNWRNGSSWRDWLPAGAVAAACLVIISVTLADLPMDDGVSPAVIQSSPAAFESNSWHLGPFPLGLHHDGTPPRRERQPQPDDDEPLTL